MRFGQQGQQQQQQQQQLWTPASSSSSSSSSSHAERVVVLPGAAGRQEGAHTHRGGGGPIAGDALDAELLPPPLLPVVLRMDQVRPRCMAGTAGAGGVCCLRTRLRSASGLPRPRAPGAMGHNCSAMGRALTDSHMLPAGESGAAAGNSSGSPGAGLGAVSSPGAVAVCAGGGAGAWRRTHLLLPDLSRPRRVTSVSHHPPLTTHTPPAQEKPVHADVGASLRLLLRRVAGMRAQQEGGPEGPQDPQLLARHNVVAAVAGAYFGQDAELLGWACDLDMP